MKRGNPVKVPWNCWNWPPFPGGSPVPVHKTGFRGLSVWVCAATSARSSHPAWIQRLNQGFLSDRFILKRRLAHRNWLPEIRGRGKARPETGKRQ